MQHSKGITVGTYTVKTKKKVNSLHLSVQIVINVKIGRFVAIEKNLQNALYVKIVLMLKIVIFSISQLVQRQY